MWSSVLDLFVNLAALAIVGYVAWRAGNAVQRTQHSAFRFRLRTLFIMTGACAVVSALYHYFGDVVILVLLLAAIAFLAIT